MKHFCGIGRDGITFGMDIRTGYKKMKANIKLQTVKNRFGREVRVQAVPYQFVAEMMEEAGWLVSERQSFKYFRLDDGPEIYIIYPDGIHI